VPHVEEIIDHYQLWPPAEAGLHELRRALATAVRNTTAGCPRAVHDVLCTIKVLGLPIGSQVEINTTVADVTVALARTTANPFRSQRLRLDDPESLKAYSELSSCSMIDIELEETGDELRAPPQSKDELQTRLLDCTMYLPVMFETPSNVKKKIPRVSVILTERLRDKLDKIKMASFSSASPLLPHEDRIIWAMQRGFLPHYLAGQLDPNHVLPLLHLMPFLPKERRGIHVRASSVVARLQFVYRIKEISIDHFLQIPAALTPKEVEEAEAAATAEAEVQAEVEGAWKAAEAAKTAAARAALNTAMEKLENVKKAAAEKAADWARNPALRDKVLLVAPRRGSSTADCFLWVPAAAQCSADGAALPSARHLLVQLQSKSTAPESRRPDDINMGDVRDENKKALTNPDVDAVLVILAQTLTKQLGNGARYRSKTKTLDVIVAPEALTNKWIEDVKKQKQ
jgi:hypothetical protein